MTENERTWKYAVGDAVTLNGWGDACFEANYKRLWYRQRDHAAVVVVQQHCKGGEYWVGEPGSPRESWARTNQRRLDPA